MNRYQKIIKYTKPLVEIDEKIRFLNEKMTTSGMYTVVDQDGGIEEVNPTFEPAPLGDFADLDNFSWADQGDGSSDTVNVSQLVTTDVEGNEQRIFDMPDLDYPTGTPLAMAIGPNQAVTGSPLGYITSSGFVHVYQINNVFSVAHTDFSRAFVEYYENNSFTQKTIYMWGPLLYRVTTPIEATQYYPSDRDFDSDPQAEKGLYGYNLLVPAKMNSIKTDIGVRARGPRVTQVLSTDNLGDPLYYPGPVTNVSPEALDYLLARSGFPRNAADFSTMNVRGPHQPVKFYPGMGFGPSGPVQNPGAGGFNIVPQPRLANSYEPEGEVLSEDLTKNDFARLNKYVKDHPEELEYAFKRYPAGDPRLSKLNFKMDEMTRASDEYVQKQFPENVERTSRVKKILAKNIEFSDPKTFKDPKQPMTYGKIYGNDSKNKRIKIKDLNKKSAGRFFKTERKKDTSRTRWIRG